MLYKINTDIFPPDYYGAKSLNASMRKFADSLIEAGLLIEATAEKSGPYLGEKIVLQNTENPEPPNEIGYVIDNPTTD
jgi:hypothetical protein